MLRGMSECGELPWRAEELFAGAAEVAQLWPEGAPGARGTAPTDQPAVGWYPPVGPATGQAVVIFPGGGYQRLAAHEGAGYAQFLANRGIWGAVVSYRLPGQGYRYPVPIEDGFRAMRWVRAQAARRGFRADAVGVMGSSAGGHLAATVLTRTAAGQPEAADRVERQSARPDFGILCYPVITFEDPHAHAGSRQQLLGPAAGAVEWSAHSAHLAVTAETPPCFVWHTVADPGVPVENSLLFATALRQAGVPFALHLFENGRHGLGLGTDPVTGKHHPWADCLAMWLQER